MIRKTKKFRSLEERNHFRAMQKIKNKVKCLKCGLFGCVCQRDLFGRIPMKAISKKSK